MPRFLPKTERFCPAQRLGGTSAVALVTIAFVCAVTAHFLIGSGPSSHSPTDQEITAPPPRSMQTGQVFVRKPGGAPRIDAGYCDADGKPVTIACNTCHANWTANADARVGLKLERFHQHLHGSHGNLACVACHNANDGYASLRLADGRSVPYPEVMQLCAQCHGPQYRDYQHGSHGGMNGYWDLSRGSRVRNNCIDCHAPHSPRYPLVMPVHRPNDRFLQAGDKGGTHEQR